MNIFVDNKTMLLENALRSGKMTIDGILVKANKDVSDGAINMLQSTSQIIKKLDFGKHN